MKKSERERVDGEENKKKKENASQPLHFLLVVFNFFIH